jgi:hypothetical protein
MPDICGKQVGVGDLILTTDGIKKRILVLQKQESVLANYWHAVDTIDGCKFGVWVDMCVKVSPKEAMFELLKGRVS